MGAHAAARATKDVDLILGCPRIGVPGLLAALEEEGFQVDAARHLRELTQDQITAIYRGAGRLDLLMPVLSFFSRIVQEAEEREVLGRRVRVARAEHLLVLKVLAFRDQDKVDIRQICRVLGGRLNRPRMDAELDQILPPTDPRRVWLEQVAKDPDRV
ncbi:MAG: nucleotidyltransferase [Planctomycetes bacterium]|nr:nucleotidyltransferase [Planctomycetota bacterium]